MDIIRSVTHLLWVNQGIWFSKGAFKDRTLWLVGWGTAVGWGGMAGNVWDSGFFFW
jgi:hypothetical protein